MISEVFDNTSILKLIEWRWNLTPLTARDASSDSATSRSRSTSNPDPSVPALPLPDEPIVLPCLISPPSLEVGLSDLIDLLPFGSDGSFAVSAQRDRRDEKLGPKCGIVLDS